LLAFKCYLVLFLMPYNFFYFFDKCIEVLKTIRIVSVTTFILVNRYVALLTLTNRFKILQKMAIL